MEEYDYRMFGRHSLRVQHLVCHTGTSLTLADAFGGNPLTLVAVPVIIPDEKSFCNNYR